MTSDECNYPVGQEQDPESTAIETQINLLTKEAHEKALEELGLRYPERTR